MNAVQTTLAAASGVQAALDDNADRQGALFYNDTSNSILLGFKGTVSTSDFAIQLNHGESVSIPGYTGKVSALFLAFESGYAGLLHVTEFTY